MAFSLLAMIMTSSIAHADSVEETRVAQAPRPRRPRAEPTVVASDRTHTVAKGETIGIVGEYLGRIFNETKGRPLYIVRDRLNLPDTAANRDRPVLTASDSPPSS